MDEDTIRAALRLPGKEPFQVQIAGGEPLCNLKAVRAILREASEDPRCRGISIQTNATLIDDEIAELLARYHVAIGVSLDGAPEVNENQRGCTMRAIHGIQTLAGHGLCANLTCVVTAYNVLQLAGIADMAYYLGNIHGIGLDLLRAAGRAEKQDSPQTQPASREDLIKGLDALCTRLDQLDRILPPERKIILREETKARFQMTAPHPCQDYCYAAQGKSYVVLPDGECYPCGSLAGDPRYDMGNVHRTIHPIEIHAERPQQCRRCEYAGICAGGCPSRGLLSGGSDPLDCVVKKYMFQRNKNIRR